jgi:3-deoxy-manno-octulosonate cytidylyltransferase (CMP-KDO synthetase)
MAKLENVVVAPARFASTRLPGKPLLSDTGQPLIMHVVHAARRARRVARVIVATDDLRILEAVRSHGGEAVLTRPDHPSGTDRVAEAVRELADVGIVVNVQGDEPEIEPEVIDLVVQLLEDDPQAVMSTVATPIHDDETFRDPARVKVVLDEKGRALYFSRSPIPHHRDGRPSDGQPLGYLHLGLYAYRRDFLARLPTLAPSPLERIEQLEQLRVLQAGHPIRVGVVPKATHGVDTPEDYRRFVERWRRAG